MAKMPYFAHFLLFFTYFIGFLAIFDIFKNKKVPRGTNLCVSRETKIIARLKPCYIIYFVKISFTTFNAPVFAKVSNMNLNMFIL